MNFLLKHIPEYVAMTLRREKVYMKKIPIILKTLGALAIGIAILYVIGTWLQLNQSIAFMFSAAIILVLGTFILYKYLFEKEYLAKTKETHPIWLSFIFDSLYVFIVLVTASLFLFFSVYLRALSPYLGAVYILLLVISYFTYIKVYKICKELDMPKPTLLLLNGLFLAVLFYAVTLLIHINDFGLSILIVVPTIFVMIQLKQYIVKRFYLRVNRYVIVFVGIFLTMLSFPFNRASNYPSIVRGEFTFRILYDTLANPEYVFSNDVKGDVLLYKDYFVIVSDEKITFYNNNLEIVRSIDNEYESVYVMNDRLLANQVTNTPTPYINLFELKDDGFEYVGNYYVAVPDDKVFIEDDAYVSLNGYVYVKEAGSEDFVKLEIEATQTPTIVDESEDFMVFRYLVPYFVSSDSFTDETQGFIFKNITYQNNHIAFVYSNVFVVKNSLKVDPRDEGKVILYLSDKDSYFTDDSVVPLAIEIPKLFKIDQFYFTNNHYYIVGYNEYSTSDFMNRLIVINEDGSSIKELVFDGPNIAISDDYIMYGNDDAIKVFTLDADITIRYRLIVGYGITFFTMAMVAVFAVTEINPVIRKKIDLSAKFKI